MLKGFGRGVRALEANRSQNWVATVEIVVGSGFEKYTEGATVLSASWRLTTNICGFHVKELNLPYMVDSLSRPLSRPLSPGLASIYMRPSL
jgi:hypothetical protein